MAMLGKRGSEGSAAVLDAPEPVRVQETQWPIPEPAPAGTLQRRKAQADDSSARNWTEDEDTYKPRRTNPVHRLRSTLLRTVAGRIVGATIVVVVLGAAAVAVASARSSLLHDPRFAVTTSAEIEITGNRHLTRAQVLSVFEADLERNIFRIPLAQRRADLERLPWVAHATVMRLLPGTLRVDIEERTPVAFVRDGSHIGLVDANGVLLDMPEDVAGDPHYSFPVLTGLSEADPLTVRAARMEVYRKFMQSLDSSGEKLTRNLSEVDVSNPEDVKAVVTESGSDVLVHFGDEKFLERYKLFAQNLPQWKNQYPKLASVDTRYENQFVLEMQAGSQVPLATTAQADAPEAAKPAKPEAPAKAAGHRGEAVVRSKGKPGPVKKPILVHAWTPGSEQVQR
jgi:cell division protein FtsQ